MNTSRIGPALHKSKSAETQFSKNSHEVVAQTNPAALKTERACISVYLYENSMLINLRHEKLAKSKPKTGRIDALSLLQMNLMSGLVGRDRHLDDDVGLATKIRFMSTETGVPSIDVLKVLHLHSLTLSTTESDPRLRDTLEDESLGDFRRIIVRLDDLGAVLTVVDTDDHRIANVEHVVGDVLEEIGSFFSSEISNRRSEPKQRFRGGESGSRRGGTAGHSLTAESGSIRSGSRRFAQ